MNVDKSLDIAFKQLKDIKDLQTKITLLLDSLQQYLSVIANISSYSNEFNFVDEYTSNLFWDKLDTEQQLIDKIWENKVYDAVCPDVNKPLTIDELKNFGFNLSVEDYAKYMNDMTVILEANLS